MRQLQHILKNALEILPDIKDVPLGMCYFQINKFDRAIELFENVDLNLLDEDILNNLVLYVLILNHLHLQKNIYSKLKKKILFIRHLKNLALLYQKKTNQMKL